MPCSPPCCLRRRSSAGPMSLNWSGAAADPGTTVPDGAYRVVVTTTDAAGVSTTSSAPVSVVRAASALTGPAARGQPEPRPARGQRDLPLDAARAVARDAAHHVGELADRDRARLGSAGGSGTGRVERALGREADVGVARRGAHADDRGRDDRSCRRPSRSTSRRRRCAGCRRGRVRGGGFVRFRLSEPAYVQLRVQGHLIGPYVEAPGGRCRGALPPGGAACAEGRAAGARSCRERGPRADRPQTLDGVAARLVLAG